MNYYQNYNKMSSYSRLRTTYRKLESQDLFFKAMYNLKDCNIEDVEINYKNLNDAIIKFEDVLKKLKEKRKQNKDKYIEELQKKLREIENEIDVLS